MRHHALALAFGLDLLIGDPRWMPHVVVAQGKAIELYLHFIEKPSLSPAQQRLAGLFLAIFLPLLSFGLGLGILWIAARIHTQFAFIIEVFLIYQVLATRELYTQSMNVYKELAAGNLEQARIKLAAIVGRDTARLNEKDIVKATVETVAENTCDGVVAPLLFAALGGAPLALAYKAINTLDSMVGYKNERFINLGCASAKLDDWANWVPARVSALLLLASAKANSLNATNAFNIWKRDRKAHASPNAGQTESVVAGALSIQLGGSHTYGGVLVAKPTIGDAGRVPEASDIRCCNTMMTTASYFAAISMIALSYLFGLAYA